MWKKLIIMCSMTLMGFAQEKEISFDTKLTQPSDYHPYFSVGVSSMTIIPYGANLSLGTRLAKPNQIVGFDSSINLTSTFISNYAFVKGMMPLYFNTENVSSSFYFGPFATVGVNYQYTGSAEFLGPKGLSMLSVMGLSFGKNISNANGSMSFWQLSTNLRRFDTNFKHSSTSYWPTWTFQFGFGF